MKAIHGGDIYRNAVMLDFSVNINPLGIPENVRDALHRAAARCDRYPDIRSEKLKAAVSVALSVPRQWLLFGNGASEIFMAIAHGLRPKRVLIPVPSFYGYEHMAQAAECQVSWFYLDREKGFLPGEDLLDALTDEVDLLILANPNNPTGKRMGKAYLERLLEKCRRLGIRVVLDECFIEFCEAGCSMMDRLSEYENLLIVRAFTKIYAIPGVRLGYLMCSDPILMERIRKQLPEWNLSTFAQEAGEACVGQSSYVKETVDYVSQERHFLMEGLKSLGLQAYESEANFILIRSEKPLYEGLLKRGILIRSCENFRGLDKSYYRIAVKRRQENEELLKAMGELI